MPFQLIRNDISKVKADAIVNSANPEPMVGRGSDMAVYQAAGYEKLLKERKKIGSIKPGEAAVTEAFDLNAKYIIHTVGPVWYGGTHREMETLASCYRKSLMLAKQLKCESIAFPMISTGVYGFPKDLALSTALKEIEAFLMEDEMDVTLVVYDRSSYQLSDTLNNSVRRYIYERRTSEGMRHEYSASYSAPSETSSIFSESEPVSHQAPKADSQHAYIPAEKRKNEAPRPSLRPSLSIRDLLRRHERTFQEQLLYLIDQKGMSDVEVYKRANLDRKLFSKIRSNKNYTPKKKTALALAVALQLDIDETKDLLSRASLALSPSSAFDLIVEYCIINGKYSIFEINSILFEYDQQMLDDF